MRFFHKPAYFFVDLLGYLVAVVAMLGELAIEEHHVLTLTVADRAKLFAHAPLRHHGARHRGDALQVIAGAGSDVAEPDLLGYPTAQQRNQLVAELLLGDKLVSSSGMLMV